MRRIQRSLGWIVVSLPLALGCEHPTLRTRVDAGPGDAPMGTADTSAPDAEGCASRAFEAESSERPIDVVIWVDDGGSFASARGKVARSIGMNLADILAAAGVDYRVILLGANTTIPAPLGDDPERFVQIDSGFSAGGGGYVFFSDPRYLAMYEEHLRDGAFRVFLSATDCEREAGTFEAFETALSASDAFVVGDGRNFVYHMIGNVALQSTPTMPWTGADPIAGRGSYGSFTACTNTQRGAVETGGLRLGVAADSYDGLFRAIAASSISRSMLPCVFDPPAGEVVDLDYVRFRYAPGGDTAAEIEYGQVAGEAACADAGGFYTSGGQLVLCPTTCAEVSEDPDASVRFTFECVPF